MTRLATRLVLLALALLVVIQFVPITRTNPPVTREVRWDSPVTRALAERACFDCHSNLTVWPWYSHVAPASLLVASHVNDGRQRLNFSEWDRPNAAFDRVKRDVTNGDMPIWNYVLLHPLAKLTPDEAQQLLTGLEATFRQDPPIPRPARAR